MRQLYQQSRLKTDLSIQPQLLDKLTNEEISFAEQQYHKMYSEQMAKLSVQIQKKKRFQKRISLIQQKEKKNVQNSFQVLQNKEAHHQLNKNINLQKKLKKYKLHQEFWENKVKQIKYKEKQETKVRLDKIKLLQKQSQAYWKHKQTKTTNRFTLNQFDSQRKLRHKSQMLQHNQSISILKPKSKQLDFLSNRKTNRQNNEFSLFNKNENSTKKLQSYKNSEALLQKIDPLKVNSKFATTNKTNANQRTQINLKDKKFTNFISNEDKGFQKTMIKLAKIERLRETKCKKQMKIKIEQTKPRKSLASQTYRALRIKTQYSKSKYDEVQNVQSHNQNNKTTIFQIFNQSKLKNKNLQKDVSIPANFFSFKEKTNGFQEYKKREKLKQELQQRYKKDKIIKAIRKSVEHQKQNQIKKLNICK